MGSSGGGGGAYVYWIPAAVHAQGAQGSQWRIDVGSLNLGTEASDISFALYTSNGIYTASSSAPIQAGSQGIFMDLVGQLGLTETGNLRLETSQPFVFTSRIFNQAASGTFGQYMDGYTSPQGLPAGQEALLPQLIQNGDFRSNIGAANMSGSPATVKFTLYRGDGGQAGTFTLDLGPGQWRQESEPFRRRFGISNLNQGYAVARVISGSGVVVYGSVVDNHTNDATTIPMKRPGSGNGPFEYWVPAAVHAPGALGSQWRIDLGALNTGGASSGIEFTLYTSTAVWVSQATSPMQPGWHAIFADLVGQMGLEDSGHLKLKTQQPFIFTARIFNQASNGTFGQFMDGYTPADGLNTAQEAYLPQLTQNANFRTNVGAANMGATTATVRFTLFQWNGTEVGSFDLSIPPGQWRQDGEPFRRRFGLTNLGAGYAVVKVISGSRIVAYASVVDNRSNDATTFPMKR